MSSEQIIQIIMSRIKQLLRLW